MDLDFSVVVLMRDSRTVAEQFVQYYLRNKAAKIRMFVDGDAQFLTGLDSDRVEVMGCDAAFWADLNCAPDTGYRERARAIARFAYDTLGTSWMLYVDYDEFVFGDRPIQDLLKAVPDDVPAVRLPTAEAVWTAGASSDAPFSSTAFRVALPTGLAAMRHVLYPGFGKMFAKSGLLGHGDGRQFIRKGADFDQLACHSASRNGQPLGCWARQIDPAFRNHYVAHFDAIGLAHWTEKWRDLCQGSVGKGVWSAHRHAQLYAIAAANRSGARSPRQTFRRLYSLSRWQFSVLSALGCAFKQSIFAEGEFVQAKLDDEKWWYHLPGSNGGPPDPQSGALTN